MIRLLAILRRYASACACLLLTCSLMTASLVARAETVYIACASNFKAPMQQLVAQFQNASGLTVKVAYGSSGKLFAQIQHGAPFHLFFSADQKKPARLRELGLAPENAQKTYAIGTLVLWSRSAAKGVQVKQRLLTGDFRRLALANPKLAPYGSAAVAVLNELGLIQRDRSKWVMGENIGQTFQFVASGSTDLGFVALSQVLQHQQRGYWVIEQALYPPIKQDALLLNIGAKQAAVRAFWDFLDSPQAAALIKDAGYTLPVNNLSGHL